MRKTLLGVALAGILGGAATAQAGTVINFDLGNGTPGSLARNQSAIDWNEAGSGVAIGQGPFGTPFVVGNTFTFLYQANMVGLTPGPVPAGLDASSNGVWDPPPSTATAFEFTVVARLSEVVSSFTSTSGACGAGCTQFQATFLRNPAAPSYVSIFYDSPTTTGPRGGGVPANTSTGAGFDDGIEVMRMNIDDGEPGFATLSTFTALVGGLGGGTGQGAAKIHGSLTGPGAFVNPAYLSGVRALIMDFDYQADLNYPPGTSATASFHNMAEPDTLYPVHAVAGNDLVLKVDGANQFTTQLPEPASLLLLGIGLLGLGFSVRGRKLA